MIKLIKVTINVGLLAFIFLSSQAEAVKVNMKQDCGPDSCDINCTQAGPVNCTTPNGTYLEDNCIRNGESFRLVQSAKDCQ